MVGRVLPTASSTRGTFGDGNAGHVSGPSGRNQSARGERMVIPSSSVAARSGRLRDVALLEIGFGSHVGDESAYPLEIGLAFCGERPPLCWLIEPEGRWEPSPATVPMCEGVEFGAGLPAAVVALELGKATHGFRVYAESHMPVNAWLRRLSCRSGVTVRLKVRDMRLLVVRPGSRSDALPTGFGLAFQRSRHAVPEISRAVVDAVRHARFCRSCPSRRFPNEPRTSFRRLHESLMRDPVSRWRARPVRLRVGAHLVRPASSSSRTDARDGAPRARGDARDLPATPPRLRAFPLSKSRSGPPMPSRLRRPFSIPTLPSGTPDGDAGGRRIEDRRR